MRGMEGVDPFMLQKTMMGFGGMNPALMQNYLPSYAYNQLPSRSHDGPLPCSTLYISGLPKDVTERELGILFRFCPGFLSVRLVTKSEGKPICFADFSDTNTSTMALQTLQDFKMDMRDATGIRIEYDRGKDSRRSRA
mmetsp:Transcript_6419/g.10504  ORF Transcript_6419/g.10504 Transcript_6419/m.10504 type:complete len:138 (+) Transcript_6419:903-1316(+)